MPTKAKTHSETAATTPTTPAVKPESTDEDVVRGFIQAKIEERKAALTAQYRADMQALENSGRMFLGNFVDNKMMVNGEKNPDRAQAARDRHAAAAAGFKGTGSVTKWIEAGRPASKN